MEKDIGRITKNPTTEVVIRIDDFADKRGLTIREFVTSERYTGFTKAGVRIQAADFAKFKEMINSIDENDLKVEEASEEDLLADAHANVEKEADKEELPDY